MLAAREYIRARIIEEDRGYDTPCWVWQRNVMSAGYGQGTPPGFAKNLLMHRVSYELHVGPIPDGLHIDHLCRVKTCVNPAHLEPVTCAENVRRALGTTTHCLHGHALTPENIVFETKKKGGRLLRKCRACRIIKGRAKRFGKELAAARANLIGSRADGAGDVLFNHNSTPCSYAGSSESHL